MVVQTWPISTIFHEFIIIWPHWWARMTQQVLRNRIPCILPKFSPPPPLVFNHFVVFVYTEKAIRAWTPYPEFKLWFHNWIIMTLSRRVSLSILWINVSPNRLELVGSSARSIIVPDRHSARITARTTL